MKQRLLLSSGDSHILMSDKAIERYSFSRLSTFNNCKTAYYNRYILGIKGIDNCFSSYGTFAHSLFERYAKGEIKLEAIPDIYEWEFDTAVTEEFPPMNFYHKVYGTDMKALYYDQGLEFFKNFNGYDDRKILGVETEFEFKIDDWVFNGVVDMIYETSDGKLIIEDHKSKGSFKNKQEQREYARQLYLYALYAEKQFGRYPTLLCFNQFRKNKVVEIPFKENELNEAIEWAKTTVSEIRSCWDYFPSPSEFFCPHICGYRLDCPHVPQN